MGIKRVACTATCEVNERRNELCLWTDTVFSCWCCYSFNSNTNLDSIWLKDSSRFRNKFRIFLREISSIFETGRRIFKTKVEILQKEAERISQTTGTNSVQDDEIRKSRVKIRLQGHTVREKINVSLEASGKPVSPSRRLCSFFHGNTHSTCQVSRRSSRDWTMNWIFYRTRAYLQQK